MLNLFIGQYKNEKTLIKFNMVRYTTMCIVLDYYCYMNSKIPESRKLESVDPAVLKEMIAKKPALEKLVGDLALDINAEKDLAF
ncbi:MAG: hypothetical protein E7087_00745 [Bacteroidales bacterium]|nr:hypothetical protein [Bacteroidales bacterium]